MNYLLLCAVALSLLHTVHAQQITTRPLAVTSYCYDETISVGYDVAGAFAPGNSFVLQISSSDGSFVSGYQNIASQTGTGSGVITWRISNVTPSGLYRFRVVGSNPYTLGTDNGAAVTISRPATAYFYASYRGQPSRLFNLDGIAVVGVPITFSSSIRSASQRWEFGEGAVPPTAVDDSVPVVTYTTPGEKFITLTTTAAGGCTATSTMKLVAVSDSRVIPASATPIRDFDQSGPVGSVAWVCPGGGLNRDVQVVFVESGGNYYGSASVVFAKSGASVSCRSCLVIYHETGASISANNAWQRIEGPLSFDYTNAPAGGCPSLAPYTKRLPDNAGRIVSDSAAAVDGATFLVRDGGRLRSTGALDTFAIEPGGHVTATGNACVAYVKNGGTFDASGTSGQRIFYELGANIIDPGSAAALLPSSGITFEIDHSSSAYRDLRSASARLAHLAPNPAHTFVAITARDRDVRVMAVTLLSLLGERIATEYPDDDAEYRLPIAGIPPGLYFVRIETSRGTEMLPLIVR